jgi:DNA-binding transcriptional LysR family regulator
MEMHQIRYFLAICEHGGFSRAAEACGVSQPALTTAVKTLEREVGGDLFHREGRRLVLSEVGRLVKPHLEKLSGEKDAVMAVARNFRLLRATPLRIGVMPTIGPARISGYLALFRTAHPGIDVAVSEAPLDRLLHQLEDNELDLALASAPQGLPDGFRSQQLYGERYVVAFRPGTRFETMKVVRLADVSGESYVDRLSCELREEVMALCAQRKIELYANFRSEREEWVQGMVQAGLGFAFMPEYSVTLPGVLARPLIEPAVQRAVLAVEVRGRPRTAAVKLLVKLFVEDVVRDSVGGKSTRQT